MKTLLYLILLGTLSPTVATGAEAQSLAGRHQISLRLGMWNQTAETKVEAVTPTVSTSVEDSGLLAGLGYTHWLEENLALAIKFSALALDTETLVSVSGVSTDFAMVGSVLLGLKRTILTSSDDASVRPFLGASVGLFRGSQDEVRTGLEMVVASRAETAFGGQLGVGADFIVGRHFMAGVAIDYNLMSDFDEPIGGSRDYSGPEFSLGFGYLFGSGDAAIR